MVLHDKYIIGMAPTKDTPEQMVAEILQVEVVAWKDSL